MNAEKKLYNNIRDWFILTDSNFLKLSEKDQNNIILAVIRLRGNVLKTKK